MTDSTMIHPNSTIAEATDSASRSELKNILVTLLQQLGLYAQATNLISDNAIENIDTAQLADLLKKHHLDFSVYKLHKSALSQSIHPFIVVPESEPAFLEIGRASCRERV